MNELAITHGGRGADCFAVDANTYRIRISTARGDFDRVDLCYTMNKYAWDTERTEKPMLKWASDLHRDYYQVDVSGEDTRLAYLFVLCKGGKRWYFTEEGLSDSCDYKLAYCFFFQYPYIHACDVHRAVSWADNAVMYQIFPERFCNGIGDKPYISACWDSEPTPRCFLGGDLVGVEKRLDYLSELGVNCLYLTPVHPSPSNHKYGVVDYEDVDAGFGGREAFISLVNAAHGRGIRVILDGVFNHCSVRFARFEDVIKNGTSSPYWSSFLIDGDKVDTKSVNYKTFGFSGDLPKLSTGDPSVISYFCDIGAMWVREYGIDGWRLDVMDELSDKFLRAFRAAVKRENPDALILGETWHDPRVWLMGDRLDGVMNYGFTKVAMDYLAFGTLSASGVCERLIGLYTRTTAQSARMMMNLIGSHDTTRFLTLLGGDVRKLKLAFCLMFFYVGIPCVYYGDEIGMEGGYDPGCRRGFPWDESKWNKELRELVKSLCRLRSRGALGGDKISIEAHGEALVITRPGARLIMNATDKPVSVVLQGCAHALDACSYMIIEG